MKRTLIVAGFALAALLGTSLALLLLATGHSDTQVPPASSAVAAQPSLHPVSRDEALPARAGGKAPGQEPTPLADRVTRKAVRRALLAAPVQSRLSRCVARDGGGAEPGPMPPTRPAVLMLEVETEASQVRIVEATVQDWGGVSAQAVSCARDALRGKVIATAMSGPGRRLRMPFPLVPRSQARVGPSATRVLETERPANQPAAGGRSGQAASAEAARMDQARLEQLIREGTTAVDRGAAGEERP